MIEASSKSLTPSKDNVEGASHWSEFDDEI